MPLVITAGPAAEPVTLAEAKAHCRADGSDEDTVINALIVAARMHVERIAGLALMTQDWSLYLDAWPGGRAVEVPLAPVQAVTSVRVYDASGTAATVPADRYGVDTASARGRIVRHDPLAWPAPGRAANGIEIAFTAGYGALATAVPQPLRQAILLLVAHWYENREPAYAGGMDQLPFAVSSLIAPYRTAKL